MNWFKKLFAPKARPVDVVTPFVIDTLARTLYGEARGQPLDGLEAVACVVLNRVKTAQAHGGRYWWGGDIVAVCRKPWQFSCWNANDPNLEKLMAAKKGDKWFDTCLRIAALAVQGKLVDKTGGATHYHTKAVHPFWSRGVAPSATIGDHVFYKID